VEAVGERPLRLRPRTILHLFSGGKGSALALLLTRDLARELFNGLLDGALEVGADGTLLKEGAH
jgi:hypothetical protein